MQVINFTTNWNNKLNCDYFITFSKRSSKWVEGKTYQINLEGRKYCKAVLKKVKPIKLEQVDEFIAALDAGADIERFKRNIDFLYPNSKESDVFVLLLFKKTLL